MTAKRGKKAADEKKVSAEKKAADETEAPNAKKSSDATEQSRRTTRRGIGIAILVFGSLATLLMMANQEQLPHGPLYGMVTMLVAAFGVVWTLGLFHRESADAVPIQKTVLSRVGSEPAFLEPRYAATLSVTILLAGGILLGYPALPWVISAALLALVPSAISRPGLLVFVIVSFLYLPFLGAYGLWDPWETHYGEVSREILSRDDWISLWWAQENWFWSKPILIFWSEALSMGALGVDPSPDANPAHPEWALRLPIYLMSIGAVLAVYAAIGRVFGKRAGVLSAIVLATMPHFFFLSHQAITDMPFVANMVIAMSLLILALREDPERQVTDYRVGRWVISGQHVLVAALFLIVAPQALYLVSRNVTMVRLFQFAWHGDEFLMGSAGNPGSRVPGNSELHDMAPWASGLVAQPVVQGLVWVAGLAVLLWFLARERRAQSLYMFAFYVFCGLAFMGKGIPGFALPGMVALLYLVASRRWSLLLDGRLRIAAGALTVAVVGLPWYVAMYIRHGPAFTDRLLVHDHINRLAAGVHGDNGSIEYFLEQIGFAMFPWVALVPAALTMWLWYSRRPGEAAIDEERRHQTETAMLIAVWFAGAFTLFNAMITKFHHYIFPAVPPAAILSGVLLDRAFGDDSGVDRWKRLAGTVLAALAPVIVVLGIGGAWGDLRGVIPEEVPQPERADWVLDHGMGAALALALVVLGIAVGAGAYFLLRSPETKDLPRTPSTWEPSLAGAMIAGTVLAAFVARDLSWVTDARPQGYERLIQLFIYNYGRPWPDHFDYRPILTGFGVVAALLFALAAFRFLRPLASRALVGIALAFTVWALDVYMIDLSPHWGQRELLKAYYEEREGPHEPVVAWQMNWKGENFYTGNRVAVFVDLDNQKIREWIAENRGTRAFFLMEHSRLNNFKSLVPGRDVREVTDMRLNNKFLLVEVTL